MVSYLGNIFIDVLSGDEVSKFMVVGHFFRDTSFKVCDFLYDGKMAIEGLI